MSKAMDDYRTRWAATRRLGVNDRPMSAASAGTRRLTSLDTFRGLTVAAMILVNNPASWGAIWPPLSHATWHGCTPTDLIFPFFLFIVGVSMAMSRHAERLAVREGRRQESSAGAVWLGILKRGGTLIALGVLLNWFGIWDPARVRIPGVLQRIGLCYIMASALVQLGPRAWQWGVPVLLTLHACLLALVPAPLADPCWPASISADSNLQKLIDDAVLSRAHLYSQPTDPEGLLGTLSATGTVLLGCGFARFIIDDDQPQRRLLIIGGLSALLGYIVAGAPSPAGWFTSSPTWAMPLNKPLWTPSYALLTGGLAAAALGLLYWILDAKSPGRVALRAGTMLRLPLEAGRVAGRNAILVFVGSGLLSRVIAMIPAPVVGTPGMAPQQGNIRAWVFESFLAPGFGSVVGSHLWAVVNVCLWLAIALALDRRRLYWRV